MDAVGGGCGVPTRLSSFSLVMVGFRRLVMCLAASIPVLDSVGVSPCGLQVAIRLARWILSRFAAAAARCISLVAAASPRREDRSRIFLRFPMRRRRSRRGVEARRPRRARPAIHRLPGGRAGGSVADGGGSPAAWSTSGSSRGIAGPGRGGSGWPHWDRRRRHTVPIVWSGLLVSAAAAAASWAARIIGGTPRCRRLLPEADRDNDLVGGDRDLSVVTLDQPLRLGMIRTPGRSGPPAPAQRRAEPPGASAWACATAAAWRALASTPHARSRSLPARRARDGRRVARRSDPVSDGLDAGVLDDDQRLPADGRLRDPVRPPRSTNPSHLVHHCQPGQPVDGRPLGLLRVDEPTARCAAAAVSACPTQRPPQRSV